MPRDIDRAKQRKALRKLRKAAELAEQGLGPPLSEWERTFLEEVEARIETYGSAFADPEKGQLEDPLSMLQSAKLKEIDRKARGKGGGLTSRRGLGRKSGLAARRTPERDEDAVTGETTGATENGEVSMDPPSIPEGRPRLRVIKGGRDD